MSLLADMVGKVPRGPEGDAKIFVLFQKKLYSKDFPSIPEENAQPNDGRSTYGSRRRREVDPALRIF